MADDAQVGHDLYEGTLPGSMGAEAVPKASDTKSVRNMQAWLRRNGYNIKITGVMNQRTKDAKKDWESGANKRNPYQWNVTRNLPMVTGAKPGAYANYIPDDKKYKKGPYSTGGGNTSTSGAFQGGGGGGNKKSKKKGKKDPLTNYLARLKGLTAKGSSVGTPIPMSILDELKQTNKQIDAYMKKLYQTNTGNLRAQSDQNIADIQGWYGDVKDEYAKALARDAPINARALSEMGQVQQGLISSIGGSANPGSAGVAAAGTVGNAMMRSFGAAEEQYNNDMQPLVEQEAAGMSARQRALLSQNIAEMSNQFAGQAIERKGETAAQTLGLQMDIYGQNNALAQQQYQNQVGGISNEIAYIMSRPDLTAKQLDNAMRIAQLEGQSINNQGASQALNGQGSGGFVPWNQLPPPDRMQLTNTVIETTMQQYPQGTVTESNFQYVLRDAFNYMIEVAGIDNAAAQSIVERALRAAYGLL